MSSSMSRLKSAAAKNIDINIADILCSEILVCIDISKSNIDPALVCQFGCQSDSQSTTFRFVDAFKNYVWIDLSS